MATQLSKETIDNLADFLRLLSEFRKNPLDLSFYLETSDILREPSEFKKILEDFRRAVDHRKQTAAHFAYVIRSYSPKVLPFTQASREKAAKAAEEYAESLEDSLKCMEYHLETGEFPPGMTSLKDCLGIIKGLDILSQYLEIGYEALKESRTHGKPTLTKYLKEIEEGDEGDDAKARDFWTKLKGKDFKTQIKEVVKHDPKFQRFDVDEVGDDSSLVEKDEGEEGEEGDSVDRTYSRLVNISKRYNTLLHDKGVDHWIVLGAVISTKYKTHKDTKKAGRSRTPKIFLKETSDFLAIRNIPILGIKAKQAPNHAFINKVKAELMEMRSTKSRGKDALFFQRVWAKYWDVCSPPKYVQGFYYFVLWPHKFRGSRSDLELLNWDFNKASSGKSVSLEVEKI